MSMASRASSHISSQTYSSDKSGDYSDESHILEQNGHKTYRDTTDAWWSVEYTKNGTAKPLTHQSAKLSLTAGNRVFGNHKDDLWDLSDSLLELFEQTQEENLTATLQLTKRNKTMVLDVDPVQWLDQDSTNGFIRIYAPNTNYSASQLIPCSLNTSAHKITLMLGVSLNALHIQFNGDVIRRLDPYEHPLVLQNEYLAGLGYTDIRRIQEAGLNEETGFLVRFYAGKPFHDSTFSRNQLEAYIDIRKGKVIQQWVRRLCSISGTRLLIYKDKFKQTKPTIVQLAKGRVEEVKLKGHDRCLRITSTLQGERSIYLSFSHQDDYLKWLRKCKKATDKLPTSADLSNCHLEYLPENLFINDQLAILNLRHNVLKERPVEEDIYTIGWIDDLPKFQNLRSLNLADNQLVQFPLALCFIHSLVELNLASNKLEEVPSEISNLTSLQALHLHNNHLPGLPDELVHLGKLFVLVLAFNRFTSLPPVVAYVTDVRISEVENVIMAGNQIEKLSGEALSRMKYARKVDLRLNQLTLPPNETVKFAALEHLTHLDIRDNKVVDLDIRVLKTLEYLNCERNDMQSLHMNGQSLKNLFASSNRLQLLAISPKPEWLLQIDVSFNKLTELPEWLGDCFFLQKIQASHNLLQSLPPRLFCECKKLKSLRVQHNFLRSLPDEVAHLSIEEIYLQHNCLTSLPEKLLQKANKLRVLNITKNRLTQLPPLSDTEDLNKVQEFYAACNALSDSAVTVVTGYPRLKVLNIAHNEIRNISDEDVRKMDVLTELNISGNQLKHLPAALGELTKLVTLRAHSNQLQALPDFKQAASLRVLDVGHNRLMNVSVTSLMASQLNLLDMSLNAQLTVDPAEFKHIKHKKSVCLVDLTGQNRSLPGLNKLPMQCDDTDGLDPSLPWKTGFSETSGIRNKLCVATLKLLKFRNEDEAVFAMFDGGRNNEVPKLLLESMPRLLQAELSNEQTSFNYMKYTMLSAHRELKLSGQKLGASAVLMHLRRHVNHSTNMNHYILHLANVGDVEAVLCRRGEAMVLTRRFTTEDREECNRVYKADGIITEDSKVGGTTKNTRLLGCGYLYPQIVPDPHVHNVTLCSDDEFIIIANRGLWKYVSYEEAVEDVYEIGNPVVAAKHLQDLAQGYCSRENIAVLVIRLNTDSQPSLWRLRRRDGQMSVDDIEAAQQHQQKLEARQKKDQQRKTPVEVPPKKVAEVEPMKRSGTSHLHSSLPMIETTTLDNRKMDIEEVPPLPSSPPPNIPPPSVISDDSMSTISAGTASAKDRNDNDSADTISTDFDLTNEEVEKLTDARNASPQLPLNEALSAGFQNSKERIDTKSLHNNSQEIISTSQEDVAPFLQKSPKQSPSLALKPLPNQVFRKKNAATEWEALLQKRLTEDVKDKEMRLSVSQVLSDSGSCRNLPGKVIKGQANGSVSARSMGQFSQKPGQMEKPDTKRTKKTERPSLPWQQRSVTPNPYMFTNGDPVEEDDDIMYTNIDEALTNPGRRQSNVQSAIAMFENINQPMPLQRHNPARTPVSYRRSMSNEDDNGSIRGRSRRRIVIPGKTVYDSVAARTSNDSRVRSSSYDIADSRGNLQSQLGNGRVRYHDVGSHTTVISIPGATIASSKDNIITTSSSQVMNAGEMYATVRRIRHSRPQLNEPASNVSNGVGEKNITVVEIARL